MNDAQERPRFSERFARGATLVTDMFPNRETNRGLGSPEEIRREWGIFTMETVMGDVWSRPGLSLRNRSLTTVAALTALHRPHELRLHAAAAMRNGLSRQQLCDVVMHVAGYAGFPVGVEGMQVLREVFDAHPELDPPHTQDPDCAPHPELPDDRFERGRALLRLLFPDREQTARLAVPAEITPDWGRWIVATAFGDLWSRPSLSLREHSRVTTATLMALNLPEELRLHVAAALNLGIPRTEIAEQIMHLAIYGGFPVAVEGMRIARDVFDATP